MKKRVMSMITSIVLVLFAMPFNVFDASAICCRKNGFDKSKYTLSGDMAKDVATIAKSQNGRTQSQFGYTEAWCDEFVADCIENAGGGSDIVAHGGTVGDFLKIMKKKGAEQVTTPKAGDLVFYYRSSTNSYPHVAIMLDSTNSAHGNIWLKGYSQSYCMSYKSYGDGNGHKIGSGLTAVFMRPAYKSTTSISVNFYRNQNKDDTTSVTEKFTTGVSNQKFGYKTDGSGRYSKMNDSSVGFGQWSNSGCKMLGWSTDRNATKASWETYAPVVDSWIKKNAPSINLYAVWEKSSLTSIKIETPPTYKIYPKNGRINTDGLSLNATYSDGTTKTISEGFNIEADLSSIGKTKVTVTFDGKSVIYDVEVTNYFDGDGTEENPYIIKSKNDLITLSSVVNNPEIYYSYKQAYYKQIADIDLENEIFIPIGIYKLGDSLFHYCSFDGVYDGNKYKITNLNVNWSGSYAGLFGRTQRHSIIKNLSVYGNVTGEDVCTGGIAGEVGYGGKVLNCSFNGTVIGVQFVGGITSSIQGGGTVSSCYANAVVKTELSGENAWAGGIVGRPHVGNASNSENGEVSNCYFIGSVSGSVTGGIVGKTVIDTAKNNTVNYSNNYFLKTDGLFASGDNSIELNDGRGLSEELMKNISEMLGTPFVLNWSNNLNDGYPVFEWQILLRGDADNNGKVNVADAVILEKWLLGSGDLINWQNVDLCNDNIIDVFDMIEMRKLLVQNNSLSAQ